MKLGINYIASGATISADGRYRYLLWREWRGTHDPANWEWLGGADGAGRPLGTPKPCLFVMLNPSTADGQHDDPTIRRCVAFARAWNYERLEVVNLFAYRAADPATLRLMGDKDDPVGPENLRHVRLASERAGLIVCAWGSHGNYMDQAETALWWIDPRACWTLGFTKNGQPRHPLYVPSGVPLVPMEPAR